jgi:uracil-DNA glycosylase family 4
VNPKGCPTTETLEPLHAEIIACRRCPRLVAWRERVAREKRRAFLGQPYWGRPLPGFGDPGARVVLIGLAPAAHGGNRTGRFFTGDRSGDFLFAGLHRLGLANQPTSTRRDDGLMLDDVYIVAPVRCAPPDNRPTPEEFRSCSDFFDRELALLPRARVFVALGAFAWEAILLHLGRSGVPLPRPRTTFAHAAELAPTGAPRVLGCYHVSQQNTQTGRLTPAMFDGVMRRALAIARENG